jgi:hypothetical protein
VLDDYWIGSFRLRSVPCVHLLVDGRERFLLGNELLGFGVAGPSAEQGQRDWADVRLQCFPGLIAYRACRRSWMMLFDFSCGDKAISSEAAASTIQNAG